MSKKLLMNNGGMNNRLKVRYTYKYSDSTLPTFNSDFVYEVNNIDNGNGTYTREIYSDDDFTSVKFGSRTYPISVDYLAITNKVTSMASAFYSCSPLEYVNVTNWDISNVTSLNSCFANCSKLTEIKGIENWNVHKVNDLIGTFQGCTSLKSLDLSNWYIDTINFYCYMMFYRCEKLESLKLFNCDITKSSVMMNVFYNCKSLTALDLTPLRVNDQNIYAYGFSFKSCFANCSKLTEIKGIENWKVKVDDMTSMFQGCNSLKSLDLSNLDTSKLTTLEYTFSNCISLTSLNLSSWDVSNVTNMSNTFYNCPYLTILGDTSSWQVNNVTNMRGIFAYCSSLELPSLASWDTSNVTDMSEMFAGRWNQSISDLCIENWNTSNVTNMSWMFHGCVNGWYDLHLNWDTYNVTNMSNMFNGFYGVQGIYINNWVTSSLTDVTDMFLDCQADSITVSPDFPYTEEDTGYSGYFIKEY